MCKYFILVYGSGSKKYKTAYLAKTYLGASPKLFVKSAQASSAKEAARAYSPCRLSALVNYTGKCNNL